MVLKNRKKFVRAIFIIVGVIIFINVLIADKSYSHQDVKYKTLSVLSGDTLWNIAEEEQETNTYYEGKDIRDIIQNIKNINNLDNCNLKIGQTLQIPIY